MPVEKQDLEPQHGYVTNLPSRDALLADLEGGSSEGGIRHRRRARYRRSTYWVVAIWTASALRRLADASLAALLIVVLSPFLLVLIVLARFGGGGMCEQP